MKPLPLYIIMPVKDSLEMAKKAIRQIVSTGYALTVYNDNSTDENTRLLEQMAASEPLLTVVNIRQLTSHPSPNYRLVLQQAQQHALNNNQHLVIVESDVFVQNNTFERMYSVVENNKEGKFGLVAAVTTDQEGTINYPYEYARKYDIGQVNTSKRLSFCCTLLSLTLLKTYSFSNLDETKNWYDVFISHMSVQKGLSNILLTDTPVVHLPHSSRPWKKLKYTNPLLYYWRKLTKHLDRI